ncbi:MAG TPA: adenylate/guanylate cyclase domain-containing protein, partial [Methyloceanibacter sp.]|nr:adenylate/guanylate cyclase domain-containing protein [Methyloceanibacter sp.]
MTVAIPHSILPPIPRNGAAILRLLPNIRYGTERYPEKVARRLRALNLTTWIASAVASGFAIVQSFDTTPGVWKVAAINALAALVCAAIPLLHRFGPLAGAVGFISFLYVYFFVDLVLMGTGTGMHFYYLVGTALMVLFFGTERIVPASAFGAVAVAFLIAAEILVPRDAGLLPTMTLFGNFVATTITACTVLMVIVLYALSEAARAEAAAEREYERSESLLVNVLPAPIAGRLKSRTEAVIADKYDGASILFADMAGFTARASDTAPDDLVQFLNHVFTDLDRMVERHGLEKIKTTGDAYMVVSGVPLPRPDHAQALAQLALNIRDAAMDLRDPHGRSVPIRIGISSGPVVAGVIGTRKFFYDVWGDAVNVASRMETTGAVGKIQISQETYERLKDDFVLDDCGEIIVRGKGRMRTWFLEGKQRPPLEPVIPDGAASFAEARVTRLLGQRGATL